MQILEAFTEMFDLANGRHEYIVNTPRVSAKTTHIAQLAAYLVGYVCRNKPRDIVFFRANANSLVSSIMSEVEKQLVSFGIQYETRTAPHRLIVGRCNIYFLGVSGHDQSRVRGFNPRNPLIAIIGDECQQISSRANLDHARSTFIRYLDECAPYRVILCGNPHEVKAHWWNAYAKERERVCAPIKSTWKDLYAAGILPQTSLEEILTERKINPVGYRFMYEGDVSSMCGGAYPAFNRSVHLVSPDQAGEIFKGERIHTILWGGDGAITHDATAIVPIAVMSSGRACVLERFFFDPLRYGRALAPSELSELICDYVKNMDEKYGITRDSVINSVFVIDGAAQDLAVQLRYDLTSYHTVKSFTTKNIIRNNSSVNNVFARGMCYIIDYGGYYDFATRRFIKCADPLAEQLEGVTWKGSGYDPAIPNDISDALTYGLSAYYENPLNLKLPERKNTYA